MRRPTSLSSAAEAGVLETHSLYTYTSPSLSRRGWCLISSTSKFVRLVGLEPTTPWLVDYPRFELAWTFPIVLSDDIKSPALAIWAMDALNLWWRTNLNRGPLPYQGSALTNWATPPYVWEVMESNHPMPKQPDFILLHIAMTSICCCSLDYVITVHFCLGVWSIVCTRLETMFHLARRHRAYTKHSIHRISQIITLDISIRGCNISQSGPLPTTV